MSWTKVAKPSGTNWTKLAKPITNWSKITKSSGTAWTKITKPSTGISGGSVAGNPIGLLLALTYATATGGTATGTKWTKLSKASGTSWTKITKPT